MYVNALRIVRRTAVLAAVTAAAAFAAPAGAATSWGQSSSVAAVATSYDSATPMNRDAIMEGDAGFTEVYAGINLQCGSAGDCIFVVKCDAGASTARLIDWADASNAERDVLCYGDREFRVARGTRRQVTYRVDVFGDTREEADETIALRVNHHGVDAYGRALQSYKSFFMTVADVLNDDAAPAIEEPVDPQPEPAADDPAAQAPGAEEPAPAE
jgi:hypothetical protein